MKFALLALSLLSLNAIADVTFSRDERPVDGALTELTIKNENARNEASVKLISKIVSRTGGGEVTAVLFEEEGMDCVKTKGKLVCTADDRPADGALSILTVKQTKRRTWNVSLESHYWSRMGGGEVVKKEILAEDLEKQK